MGTGILGLPEGHVSASPDDFTGGSSYFRGAG